MTPAAPSSRRAISCITYAIWRSAISMSEKLPMGLFGPFNMNRFGKPGTATDR
jgi:hypothetical protein